MKNDTFDPRYGRKDAVYGTGQRGPAAPTANQYTPGYSNYPPAAAPPAPYSHSPYPPSTPTTLLSPPGSSAADYAGFDKKVEDLWSVAPEIAEEAKELPYELRRLGIKTSHEAQVVLILDISASMENPNKFYSSGKVNRLVNKALALGYMFDDDGTVQVIPFGAKAHDIIEVGLSADADKGIESYENIAQKIIKKTGFERATNYHDPVKALREEFFHPYPKLTDSGDEVLKPQKCKLPVFAIFVTDGECNKKMSEAKEHFRYSSWQGIFWKAIALQGSETHFKLLQELDDKPVVSADDDDPTPDSQRNFIDNFDFVQLRQPEDLTHELFLREYPGWLMEANQQEMFRRDPCIDVNKIRKDERVEADYGAYDHRGKKMTKMYDTEQVARSHTSKRKKKESTKSSKHRHSKSKGPHHL